MEFEDRWIDGWVDKSEELIASHVSDSPEFSPSQHLMD